MNVLCLIGIFIGFVAMVSVWRFTFLTSPVSYDWPIARIETGFILFGDSLERLQDHQMTTFYIGVMLAAAGVIIGFATPLGGVLEIAGACLFLSVTPSVEFLGGRHGTFYFLRIGPFIALISGSLMVLSLALPLYLARGLPPGNRWKLLLTLSINHRDAETVYGRRRLIEITHASWTRISSSRIRAALAAGTAAVLIASVGLSLNDSYTKESAKIAIHVTTDTSDSADFSIQVDDRLTYYSGSNEVLRNYYVEAGEHHIYLTVTNPTQNDAAFDIYILPLQTKVITVLITDETWMISRA